jgi:hypothetical protein
MTYLLHPSDTPLMLNTSHVPQHLLLMCCVLRYIMTQNTVLRKPGEAHSSLRGRINTVDEICLKIVLMDRAY